MNPNPSPQETVKDRDGNDMKLYTGLAYKIKTFDNTWIFASTDKTGGDRIVETHGNSDDPRNRFVLISNGDKTYKIYHPDSQTWVFPSSDTKKGDYMVETHGNDKKDDGRNNFSFKDNKDGTVSIFNPGTNLWLFQSSDMMGGDAVVEARETANEDPRSKVIFIPSIKTTVEISNFIYDSSAEDVINKYGKEVSLFQQREFKNTSKAKINETVTDSESKQRSVALSFKESLKFSNSLKIKATVPGVAEVEDTFSTEVGYEANQQFSFTKTKTYTISTTIEVPPESTVKFFGYVQWVTDCVVTFKATAKVTGQAERLMGDGTLAEYPVNGASVMTFLESTGFDGKNMRLDGDGGAVLADVIGTLKGSYGVKTYSKITE